MAAHPRDSKSGELRRGPDSEGFGGPPDRVDRLAAHAKLLQPVLKRSVGDRPAAAFHVVEFVLEQRHPLYPAAGFAAVEEIPDQGASLRQFAALAVGARPQLPP